jgi:hypothetical protein
MLLPRFLPMFVIVWLQAAASAWALDPARHITQYAHIVWRIRGRRVYQLAVHHRADARRLYVDRHCRRGPAIRRCPLRAMDARPRTAVAELRGASPHDDARRERVDRRPWLPEPLEGAHAHELRHWIARRRCAGRGQRRDGLDRKGL